MSISRSGGWTGACAVAILVTVAPPALAQNYTYTNVVDSNSATFAQFGIPRINNAGFISFNASLDSGRRGVYRSNGTTTVTIADTTGPFQGFFNETDINDAGQVAFGAATTVAGVYRGSGGPITTIADSSGSLGTFRPHVRINESGLVAFNATGEGFSPTAFVLAGSGGTLTTIGISPASINTSDVYQPEINDAGLVSYGRWHLVPGVPGGSGVSLSESLETSNGGTGATLFDFANPLSFASRNKAAPINNSGHSVFTAGVDAGGGDKILLHDGTGIQTLIDTSDGQFQSFVRPEINASDDLAFLGTLTGGTLGIFDGPNGTTDRVVIDGQSLFGSTMNIDSSAFGGMNDAGQIVFRYSLGDGRTGIAIATPVPEPAGTLALAAASLGLLHRRRARV